jgi:hypothetical protein
MKLRITVCLIVALVISALCFAEAKPEQVTLHAYVLDSACAFTKDLKKPVSESCARECAKAGSPLVILSDAGEIYWPISEKTPAEGQNTRLLPFAGKKVNVTGRVYSRGGSKAIVIDKIEKPAMSN